MSEENEEKRNPKLAFKDLANGASIDVELLKSKAIFKEDHPKYGEWQLWAGKVENATVHEGRGNDEKLVTGYSGEVVFFPSEKLIPELEKATNGNDGVKIRVTKTEKKSMSGKSFTVYEVEKLSDGRPSESSVTSTDKGLIEELQELQSQGFDVTKDMFIKASQEPQYENKITEERAAELYEIFLLK